MQLLFANHYLSIFNSSPKNPSVLSSVVCMHMYTWGVALEPRRSMGRLHRVGLHVKLDTLFLWITMFVSWLSDEVSRKLFCGLLSNLVELTTLMIIIKQSKAWIVIFVVRDMFIDHGPCGVQQTITVRIP